MLLRTVKSLDEVQDEALKPYYTQNESGAFTLNIEDKEGGELRSKLQQVSAQRDESNRKLKDATTLLEPFLAVGKDATELSTLLSRNATLEIQANANSDPAETEKRIGLEVDRRLESMQREFTHKIKTLETLNTDVTGERDGLKATVHSGMIRDALNTALAGVASPQPGALNDIHARAEREFKVNPETMEIEAFDEQGNRKFGKEGKFPQTVAEWAGVLHLESPFLFVQSSGGGASGSGGTKTTPSYANGSPVVDVNDAASFGKNLAAVASGGATLINA